MLRVSLLVYLICSWASHAAASDAVELEYQAAPTCPPREWLLPRVVEALGPLALQASPNVVLQVSRTPADLFVGDLALAVEATGGGDGARAPAATKRWSRSIEGALW